MRIRILGSAAGGGVPQWNCRCVNCEAVRAGSPDVLPRTQSSVAVSADGCAWLLLNASPDIRQQILAYPELAPPDAASRGTAVAGCVLTDAELDHTTGLLLMREGCTFGIASTPLVRRWLNRYLPIERLLGHFAERPWTELALDEQVELPLPDGRVSGLRIRAFELGPHVPKFVPENSALVTGSVVGLDIEDVNSGGKLVYAPGVESLDGPLASAARDADCVLMDGTFWDDEEPIRTDISDRTATQMGHVPVSGPDGSLRWLAELPVRHRTYLHINNTNPMLRQSGPEHSLVNKHGVRVGADGDVFEL